MLNAMEHQTGHINVDKFKELFKQIEVIEVIHDKITTKLASIEQLSNQDGIISALAFDQRGALKE